MSTSVIIPHRDRLENLHRTLKSIRAYFPGEIIVIDDGSRASDRVMDLCDTFNAFYYAIGLNPTAPFRASASRNAGAAFASGDVLLFNDADVTHDGLTISGIERELEVSGHGLVVPEVRFWETGALRPSREQIYSKLEAGESTTSGEWLFAWSTLLAVPRTAFMAIGGFDQAFEGWGLEDMDFSYRAARVGFKFHFTKRALGIHWPHPEQPDKDKTRRRTSEYFEAKHGFPLPCVQANDSGEVVDLRNWRRS